MVNGTVKPVSHVQLKILTIERDISPRKEPTTTTDADRARNPTSNSLGNSVSSISPTNSSNNSTSKDEKIGGAGKRGGEGQSSVSSVSSGSSSSDQNNTTPTQKTPKSPPPSDSSNNSPPGTPKDRTKPTTTASSRRLHSNVPNILCKVERVEDGREGSLLLYDLALEEHELLQENKSYLFSSLYQFLEVRSSPNPGSGGGGSSGHHHHPQLTFLLPYPLRTSIIKRPSRSSLNKKKSRTRKVQACVAVAKDKVVVESHANGDVGVGGGAAANNIQTTPNLFQFNNHNPQTSSVEIRSTTAVSTRNHPVQIKKQQHHHHHPSPTFKSASYY